MDHSMPDVRPPVDEPPAAEPAGSESLAVIGGAVEPNADLGPWIEPCRDCILRYWNTRRAGVQ